MTFLLLVYLGVDVMAQQSTISYNADSEAAGTNMNGPHLLLEETGDAGNGSQGGGVSDDGWARLWFKNSSSPSDRWSFLARPHSGATDNDGVITQPLVMAHNAVQKFGFGSDGTLRINKQYTLPNTDGTTGQVMSTDGNGSVTWTTPTGGGATNLLEDADSDSKVSFLEGSTGTDTDTMIVEIGQGSGSQEIVRFSNTSVLSSRRLSISMNSTPTAPQLRLTESTGSDASRLFFTNEATGNNWNLTGNGGSNANNVRFNINYNGNQRVSYQEADSTLYVLNNISTYTDTQDESYVSFTNAQTQTSGNEFRITGDPSNTGTEAAYMHFDWKSTSLERDFLTFNTDISGGFPTIEMHQNVGIGTLPYTSGSFDYKLHVDDAGSNAAAHFGPHSSQSIGYVTINRPAGTSNSVLRLREAGNQIADFKAGDITLEEPTTIREDVTIIGGDLDVRSGHITVNDFLRVEPITTPPTCAAGGANNGTVIFQVSGATKKLRVCVDGSWENLH